MADLTIITPEKVSVTYKLAAPSSRVFAHIVDLFMFGFFGFLIGMVFSPLESIGMVIILLYWSLGYFVGFGLLEYFCGGQTLGKFVAGLRAVMVDGTSLTFAAAMYRNLMRAADFLPTMFFMGLASMGLTPRAQRFGDLLANTVVISKRETLRPVVSPHQFGFHPLEKELPPLRRMNIAEYRLLKQIADRAPEFPKNVLDEKIEQIWPRFSEKHQIKMPPNIHPIYMIEATVMKYGRERNLT